MRDTLSHFQHSFLLGRKRSLMAAIFWGQEKLLND
jgi:hypothetical protein